VSRDELGGGPRGGPGWAPPADAAQEDASDLDAPARLANGGADGSAGSETAAAPRAAGARPSPGRRLVAVGLAAALAAGGFALGHRSGSDRLPAQPGRGAAATGSAGLATGAQEDRSATAPELAAYAQLFPDEDDRRTSTVVVSWAGVQDLDVDARVVVAVLADERTRVVGARLGDGPAGREGLGLDRGDLARTVLAAAGERSTEGVPVVALRRSSGTVAVELVDENHDLSVATTPRVHLAVVRGTGVQQLVAVPLAGPRPRA